MFGFRPDGKLVKDVDPITKIVPYIMSTRNDACNLTKADIVCDTMDEWIRKQREEKGISFNYMHLLIAAGLRAIALKPKLNRFVVNGRIYQRHGLYLSITLKESLKEDAPDITIKIRFTGQESVYEVKEKMDAEMKKAFEESKNNSTTKAAKILTFVPAFLIKLGVGFVKLLDRWGLIPNSILNVSPFHTSVYLTNLKSIKGETIYHHLYNFGTTGLFISMGKEQMRPVVTLDETIEPKKVLTLGFTTDERFCDGFYFMKALRLIKGFMADPSKMEERVEVEPFESKKERKKRLKAIAKAEKLKAKQKDTKKSKKNKKDAK